MVFGTNALFTKPAQSLAPMMVLTILNQFGYQQLKDAGKDSDPRYRCFFSTSRSKLEAEIAQISLTKTCVRI